MAKNAKYQKLLTSINQLIDSDKWDNIYKQFVAGGANGLNDFLQTHTYGKQVAFANKYIILGIHDTLKVALNSNKGSYCVEYESDDRGNTVKRNFAYYSDQTFLDVLTTEAEDVVAWLVCFTTAVMVKNNLTDKIVNDSLTFDALGELADAFEKEFDNLSAVDQRSAKTAPWGYLDLQVSTPDFCEELGAFALIHGGQIDYKVKADAFEYFVVGRKAAKKQSKEAFDKMDFTIDANHIYTDLETDRLNNNKVTDGYVPTSQDIEMVGRIYNSITKQGRGPSIFYYGEAGTGKSEKGKFFASKLGIPYTFICCSATTNEADLRGKPQNLGTSGGMVKFFKKAIKQLWGKDVETTAAQESDEITYSLTELVLACQNGWIIEVQEPTLIVNAGTLGFLNCVLDNNRTLILPNGKQIKVHPNTVFIFTTNLLYEGCNLLNNSLLSRMDYVINVKRPTVKEQIERVISVTGYDGKKDDIKKVVQAVNEITTIIQDNEISQGVCDLRCAIDCVNDYMHNDDKNWRNSARLTMQYKAILEPGFESAVKLKLDSIFGDDELDEAV